MVLDGVKFGAASHAAGLQTCKSQGTNVILVYLSMNDGDEGSIKAHSSTGLTDDSNKEKEVLVCHAEGNVRCFYGGRAISVCRWKLHRTGTKGQDDIASAAAGTMGVQGVLMSIETSKVSIRITIHMRIRGCGHNNSPLSMVPLRYHPM
jgi:hypothetical protein